MVPHENLAVQVHEDPVGPVPVVQTVHEGDLPGATPVRDHFIETLEGEVRGSIDASDSESKRCAFFSIIILAI